ncbi:MAG: hypothetical protein FD189_1425 [Elusimicrobia bacterium]|nr:MAG: hypothetical protein FD154_1699 [Elusimicrobiota bacterium]KAF0155406.1 MAG: hypothetical protein FD189_1425 [Elusimicrobiota bacterium]
MEFLANIWQWFAGLFTVTPGWMIFGGWMAAGLTLCIYSFLYKDNPFFKVAEHLYLGAGMGWVFQVTFFQTWKPRVWDALMDGQFVVLIPTVLGLSLMTQFFPRISWISRYGFTFIMGYGAGLVIPLEITTNFLRQIGGTIAPFAGGAGFWAMVNGAIIAFGFICVLFYFFFSVEQKGVVKKASNIGIYFLMLYFGAAFGNTVMGRFSLLYGRFDDLYKYSGSGYFYATHVVLGLLVAYFVLDKLVLSKKNGGQEPAH